MSDTLSAKRLLAEMFSAPQQFYAAGKPYALLQHYFSGFPLETLRPALVNSDEYLRRSALFIASELGSHAQSLVDDVVPCVESDNPQIKWDAMEVLAACATGPYADRFVPVVRMLDDKDDRLQQLAERLLSRADSSQRAVAKKYFEERGQIEKIRRWVRSE